MTQKADGRKDDRPQTLPVEQMEDDRPRQRQQQPEHEWMGEREHLFN
jgi:hypothetical protein